MIYYFLLLTFFLVAWQVTLLKMISSKVLFIPDFYFPKYSLPDSTLLQSPNTFLNYTSTSSSSSRLDIYIKIYIHKIWVFNCKKQSILNLDVEITQFF